MGTYEKKYEEALERARKLQENSNGMILKKWLWNIFPELKESDDERIRKELISYIKQINYNNLHTWNGINLNVFIAWLEKQGEHANFLNKIQVGDKVTRNRDGVLVNLSQLKRVAKTREKQGEHKASYTTIVETGNGGINALVTRELPTEMKTAEESLGIDSDTYNKIIDECIFGEQNPTDKLEPKFKVGDWVTTNFNNHYFTQITSIEDTGYETNNPEGFIRFKDEKDFHLWTIKDARDGDVLVHNSIIFIFMGIKNGIVKGICPELSDIMLNFGEPEYDNDYCPATKEQRDALTKAMTDAGYTFDFEKKELKKIEQKPTDEEMKRLLQTEYEKGRADAIAEMQKEWSEGDEEEFEQLLDILHANGYESFDIWLKSLKDRYTWKLSDEQMEALNYVVNLMASSESPKENDYYYNVFKDLRKQLKKLKEE